MTTTPTFPPEIWLQITWHLDLPDLDALAASSRILRKLTRDPALHRVRLLVFTPERVNRSLFSINRPSVLDLVHWNIMRGLNMERRWRTGQYLYSTLASHSTAPKPLLTRILQSVRQFNASLNLEHTRIRTKLSSLLRTPRSESSALATLYPREAATPHVARALLPAVHSLNLNIRRHALARVIRDGARRNIAWFVDGKGRELGVSGERERLAVCPSVRKSVKAWEDRLARK